MEDLVMVLACIGGLCLIGVILAIIAAAVIEIKELISKLKWRYKYKHRFDKPPTAKCYCRDCKQHGSETNRCYKFDRWHTADNWFCWDAEPLETAPRED